MPETVYDAHDRLLFRVRDDDGDRVMMLLQIMWIAYRPIPVATAALLLDASEFLERRTFQITKPLIGKQTTVPEIGSSSHAAAS